MIKTFNTHTPAIYMCNLLSKFGLNPCVELEVQCTKTVNGEILKYQSNDLYTWIPCVLFPFDGLKYYHLGKNISAYINSVVKHLQLESTFYSASFYFNICYLEVYCREYIIKK